MKLRTGTKIVLVVLAFGAGTIWYGFIDRAHQSLDKDGWHIEFSHARWACHVCSGSVESLTCLGRPVPIPKLPPSGTIPNAMMVSTPVGRLQAIIGLPGWRLFHDSIEFDESNDQISAEELTKGYYELLQPSTMAVMRKKKGTPLHWCLAEGYPHVRWLDPQILDKLDWITESLKLPGDK